MQCGEQKIKCFNDFFYSNGHISSLVIMANVRAHRISKTGGAFATAKDVTVLLNPLKRIVINGGKFTKGLCTKPPRLFKLLNRTCLAAAPFRTDFDKPFNPSPQFNIEDGLSAIFIYRISLFTSVNPGNSKNKKDDKLLFFRFVLLFIFDWNFRSLDKFYITRSSTSNLFLVALSILDTLNSRSRA